MDLRLRPRLRSQAIQNVYNMLFLDLRECPVCTPPRVPTVIHVDAKPPISLQEWNHWWLVFVMAILPIGLYLLYRAYARASRAARRSIGPVVLTATFITCTSWISGYAVLTDRFAVLTPISWLQTTGALVAALTALIGLVVVWQTRGAVGDLVVELDRIEPGDVRDALARAIGDLRSNWRSGFRIAACGRTRAGVRSRFRAGLTVQSPLWAQGSRR